MTQLFEILFPEGFSTFEEAQKKQKSSSKSTRLVLSKKICLGLLEFHLGLHLGLAELCLRQIFSKEAEMVYKTWHHF